MIEKMLKDVIKMVFKRYEEKILSLVVKADKTKEDVHKVFITYGKNVTKQVKLTIIHWQVFSVDGSIIIDYVESFNNALNELEVI